MFADTHCHLDFEQFDGRRSAIAEAMQDQRMGFVVVPAVGRRNIEKVEQLCERFSRFYMGLGLHPYFIEEHTEADLCELELAISRLVAKESGKLVAVGEIGLDGTCPEIEKQRFLFESQLAIAQRFRLPVIVHSRACNELMFKCLNSGKVNSGVIHAFSGSYELLMRYIRLGFKIGVGPVLTWPSATKTRDAISRAPLDSLVLETDAPGMRIHVVSENEAGPFDVLSVFQVLKELRTEPQDVIEDSLWRESVALFGINMGARTKRL